LAAHRAPRTSPSAHRIVVSAFSFVILGAGTTGILLGGQDPAAAVDLAVVSDRATHATRGLDRTAPPTVTPAGTGTPAGTATTTAAAKAASGARPKVTKPAATATTTRGAVTVPSSCRQYSGNQRIACGLLPKFGFATSEMSALIPMWNHESNWNQYAQNPSSGSYGIPQALPAEKMASVAADWRTNPATQIRWGLGYIKGRYGSPSQAWAFWQANSWY
jgi:hypothetical protein